MNEHYLQSYFLFTDLAELESWPFVLFHHDQPCNLIIILSDFFVGLHLTQ